MLKKIDYIIYYEHVARELESIKRLKAYLDKKGMKGVILPVHFNRYKNILKYSPKILILPFLYNSNQKLFNQFKKIYGNKIVCLNLHSEQISNENSIEFLMPQDDYSRDVFHISWGFKFAKELIELGKVKREKIYITGCIRNDNIFSEVKKTLNKKTILIPSSFSLTFVEQSYIDNLTQSKAGKKLIETIKFMKKSRDVFFQILYKSSQELQDYNFIIRPHPHVEIDKFICFFIKINKINKLPENIKVEREGSIQEFFNKGEKVITWYSTSILEGLLQGKEGVILEPYKFPKKMEIDFMKYLERVSTVEDLINVLRTGIKSENIEKYIDDVYYKVDGLSYLRIAKVVEKIIPKVNANKVNLKKLISFIIKYLRRDIPKNILFKLGILGKLYPSYEGILEDCIEVLTSGNEVENLSDKNVFLKKTKNGYIVEIE